MRKPDVFISVVVTTYNRLFLLADNLSRIIGQLDEDVELIIVDNNSVDGTKAFCEDLIRHNSEKEISYYNEFEQGVSFARNRGFQLSRGEYITFVDDDVKVSPNWLTIAKEICSDYSPKLFGGIVRPYYMDDKPSWYLDSFETRMHYHDSGWIPTESNCYLSINMFFERKTFVDMGGFDIHMGPAGNAFSYGEDTDLIMRYYLKGIPAYYSHDLVVEHFVPIEKMTLDYLFLRAFETGESSAQLRFKHNLDHRGLDDAFYNLYGTLNELGNEFRLGFKEHKKKPTQATGFVQRTLPIYHSLGYFVGSIAEGISHRTIKDKILDLSLRRLIDRASSNLS